MHLFSQDFYTVETLSQADLFQKAQGYLSAKEYQKAYETLYSCKSFAPCQTMIGFFYANGLHVSRDKSKAKEYFLKAIDAGQTEAMYNLGTMLLQDKEYQEALKYLSLAAKQDHKESHYNLGLIYLYGWGTQVDKSKAKSHMQKALELGKLNAQEVLDYLKQ